MCGDIGFQTKLMKNKSEKVNNLNRLEKNKEKGEISYNLLN